jgi:hypothetical protein
VAFGQELQKILDSRIQLAATPRGNAQLASGIMEMVRTYRTDLGRANLVSAEITSEQIRKWRKGALPGHGSLVALMLFLHARCGVEKASLAGLLTAYNSDAVTRKGQTPLPWTTERILVLQRERVMQQMRPLLDRVVKFPIGSCVPDLPSLDEVGIILEATQACFKLAQPEWFVREIDTLYHTNVALLDPPLTSAGLRLDHSIELLGLHRQDLKVAIGEEADHILKAWRSEDNVFKPYNRDKVGVLDLTFYDPPDGQERQGLRVRFYHTDYFTHRVMRRLIAKARGKAPFLPFDLQQFPKIGDRLAPHCLTSFGLNVSLICKDGDVPQILLARMGHNNANATVHGRLHLAANEGLNDEDFDASGRASLGQFLRRTLTEECVIDLEQIYDIRVCELFVTRDNAESGLHLIVHTEESLPSINDRRRARSRDIKREFLGDLTAVDLTAEAIAEAVMPSPKGTEKTSYYLPGLLESVIEF